MKRGLPEAQKNNIGMKEAEKFDVATTEKPNHTTNNLSESKKDDIIKQHVNKSFYFACFICFLSFIVFVVGLIVNYFVNQDIIIFIVLSGGILKILIISIWIYIKSISQSNKNDEQQWRRERELKVMQLIEKMSDEKHNEHCNILLIESIVNNKYLDKEIKK